MLLTTGQAAAELGCAVTTFRRLVHAELLPGLGQRGNRVMVPFHVVQSLSSRRAAPLHQLGAKEIAVLRVDTAQRTHEPDRNWIGFAASLTPDDLLKALRGWWRCNPASVAAGGVLPVTLAGYVVAVLTGLEGWEKNDAGCHAFSNARLTGYVTDLATPAIALTSTHPDDRRIADLLLGARLASDSGGAIAYVTANTSD
ncbi:helix-turn-helix domain-containing protein (plasmid) [Streptomyces sp. NBC_00015]|uniref:DNA-binding protein n=1 Tax=Streptomyces sp. NBC_00015 TaxID=2903611 RepID=UPI002F909A8B